MKDKIFQHLLTLKKVFQRHINDECKLLSLTSAELFLMSILFDEGDLSQIEISRFLDCDKAHIHRIGNKLIDKNLIEFVSREQGKNQKLHLTEKGKDVVDKFRNILKKIENEIYRGISSQEIEQAKQTIDKIIQNITMLKGENKNV